MMFQPLSEGSCAEKFPGDALSLIAAIVIWNIIISTHLGTKKSTPDPACMVALRATHHAKADAWTVEDIRRLKLAAPNRPEVNGRFEWMRRDVLAIVGGNYYYETPIILEIKGQPVVWFDRDEDHRLLLSVRMITTSRDARFYMDRNDWIVRGQPGDVESPPSGCFLRVRYENGDELRIQFKQWFSSGELGAAHEPPISALGEKLKFPLVSAQVMMKVGNAPISLSEKSAHLYGDELSRLVS
ncbi:hypothetical protein [Micromonospora arida]|uniref:hypothetical protein n=1 Tax=Micromonospora arida TaxID=2203715 RepID=UPI0033A53EBA